MCRFFSFRRLLVIVIAAGLSIVAACGRLDDSPEHYQVNRNPEDPQPDPNEPSPSPRPTPRPSPIPANIQLTDSFQPITEVTYQDSGVRIGGEPYVVANQQKSLVLDADAIAELIVDSDATVEIHRGSQVPGKVQVELTIKAFGKTRELALKHLNENTTQSSLDDGTASFLVRHNHRYHRGVEIFLGDRIAMFFPDDHDKLPVGEIQTRSLADQMINFMQPRKLLAESGDIMAYGCFGDSVVRTDGFGTVTINSHTGNLAIRSANGDIAVEKSDGRVTAAASGFAKVTLDNIRGGVDVTNEHGVVFVSDVAGEAVVTTEASALSTLRNIAGALTVAARGFGGFKVSNIGRGVNVRSEESDLDIAEVGGDVDVKTGGFGEIKIAGVFGVVRAESENGGINIDAAPSRVDLKAAGFADIALNARTEGCLAGKIAADQGEVAIRFGNQVSSHIVCSADRGECKLDGLRLTDVEAGDHSLSGILGSIQCGALQVESKGFGDVVMGKLD